MDGIRHMAMELVSHAANVKLRHEPFSGGGPALTAILGGHVDAPASGPSVISPQIKAGTLRWAGLVAPRGTPEPAGGGCQESRAHRDEVAGQGCVRASAP